MANLAADFPTAVHTNTDISANTSSKLGATSPTHTQVEGKQEEEIKAVQQKVGTGASTPTNGKFLKGNGTGSSQWDNVSASDLSDFDTEVANNSAVVLNTAKRTYPSADQTKLSGIETGATADQTGAEIKAAYEAELNTNAYTDSEKTKLAGIETGAEVNTVDSVNNKTGTVTLTKSDISLGNVTNDAQVKIADKGVANGVPTLDENAKIPTSQIPAVALIDINVVASEALQLALTAQEGDVAIRTDQNKSYFHNGGTAGTMDDWSEILSPTSASVTSIFGRTGAVVATSGDYNLDQISETVTYKLFSATEQTKLSGIAEGANNYSLPTATSEVVGGVKVGTRLTITEGVLSADVQTANDFTNTLKSKLDGIAEGAEQNVIENVVDDTTPQLGGDLDTNNKNITRINSLTTDNTAVGDIVTDIVAGESLVFGNIVYLKSDGKWWKATNTAIATTGMAGFVMESKTADQAVKVLLRGFVRDDDYNFTVAGAIYLGASGAVTQTAPTTEDYVVQVLGFAVHADRFYFNPSNTRIEYKA